MGRLVLGWKECTSARHKVGLVCALDPHVLAYRLNQASGLHLERKRLGKDHCVQLSKANYTFALFEGLCQRTGIHAYLLHNHSFETVSTQPNEPDGLFGDTSFLQQARLSKDKRKPEYFLLLDESSCSRRQLAELMGTIARLKGVISAFEFTPSEKREEEHFILD